MQLKIFFVDDDADMRAVVELLLQMNGYDVVVFKDARFLDSINANTLPDLFILDRWLGYTDSFSICRFLKSETLTRQIPILIISGHPDAKKLYNLFEADAFLEKPFDMASLLTQIDLLFRKNNEHNQPPFQH